MEIFAITLATVCLGMLPNAAVAQGQTGSRAENVSSTTVVTGRVKSAVTGKYLPNARISVRGTNLTTFTDEFGSYQLANVPSGPIVLEAFYTGLDPQQAPLTLSPGQRLEHEFALTNVEHYGQVDDTIKLGAFEVSESRVREGELLAVNEQRHAPNIMNVVTTDAFGDVTGGNVAEYMNFLPGVNVETQSGFAEAGSVGVRGFGSDMTGITVDGGPLSAVGATSTGDNRGVVFQSASINNFSRIEVTKSPTPATPADSMGGSINLVSKSAFERDGAQFNYRVAFTGKSGYLSLKKTPFGIGGNTYKILPAIDFDYTLPLSKNFGVVITGQSAWSFPTMENITSDWKTSISGTPDTPVSAETPYLRVVSVIEGQTHQLRRSLGARADWRITPNSVLSIRGDINEFEFERADLSVTGDSGTTATPNPASGSHFSHGPDFVISAARRGDPEIRNNVTVTYGDSQSGNISYRFDDGKWRIDAAASLSISSAWRDSNKDKTFQFVNTNVFQGNYIPQVTQVYEGIGHTEAGRPDRIRAYDSAGMEIDMSDPNNTMLESIQGNRMDIQDVNSSLRLNARRTIDGLSFPLAVQVGIDRSTSERDRYYTIWNYNYNGINGDRTITPYLNPNFPDGLQTRLGFSMPVVDSSLVWAAWNENPDLFTETAAQAGQVIRRHALGSWILKETVDALYAQFDMRLMNNRLRALGGVRYEKTRYDGAGVLFEPDNVWVRNADGSFALDSKGNRIRKPEAGANNSPEHHSLITTYRGHKVARSFDGYYPSLHLTYSFTAKLLGRLSYAGTYGRPDFSQIVPNTNISEDEIGGLGRITTRNIALDPWSADNYDLSLEYYTDSGGSLSAGVFVKDVRDFFGSVDREATAEDLDALGLSQEYVGWDLRTTQNMGTARVQGLELDARHSLEPVARWLADFSVFANVTKMKLKGDDDRQGDFTAFRELTVNGGILFRRSPFTVQARWHHRGLERRGFRTAIHPEARLNVEPRTTMDLNLSYSLTRKLSLFANITNVFDERIVWTGYPPTAPEYSHIYRNNSIGSTYTLGVKGTF